MAERECELQGDESMNILSTLNAKAESLMQQSIRARMKGDLEKASEFYEQSKLCLRLVCEAG